MNVVITTAGKGNSTLNEEVYRTAKLLNAQPIVRGTHSIEALMNQYEADILVIGKKRYTWYPLGGGEPVFFHPNGAMFRLKRLLKGELDSFVVATGLSEGMSIIDCTLGLGADSIVASHSVGESGYVRSLEVHPLLAFLVQHGLQTYESNVIEIENAMRRVNVVNANYHNYLQELDDNSFDVVYFDPMFTAGAIESDGIKAIKQVAFYEPITNEIINQAKRVARKRVVLKDHYRSSRFEQFGFVQQKRKTSSIHFGVLEVNE
ncbi:class I SAM-dependent methyltransferase [Bacillus solimangrovi]|uniref:SAM-dependent methyltransferase n=1 Tax=Bacillus solimangrovi TaxID=1305675 RepID=A0A1E5LFH1_9BACI|nr:class I SAM-dependent methyltransferase [Bacillus solimangrovi]OEH92835.1 hypothetical protein BFG57_02235 [Bacillus solimangrovi]